MWKLEHLPVLVLLLQAVACNGQCPIKLEPSTVVVRYGDPVSVNCTVSEDPYGIGWEASEGSVDLQTGVKFVPWGLATLTDWNIGPRCFGNFPNGTESPLQCDERLNITVYKPPDSVLISAGNHKDPMLEETEYLLQCDVQNIAPVQHLTVRWYKGERELDNKTIFSDASKTPVNVSPTLLITPTSADDGEQYRCVAELDLGPEGPQPPPSVTSEPINITVHYKPFSECPTRAELGEGESLDSLSSCRAKGNPSPTVTWCRDQSEFNSSAPLTRRDGGRYIVNATNNYGKISYALIIHVLYKPLISECPKHMKLREGESLDALGSCTAEGNPSPEVTWYKDQSRVNSSTPLTKRDSGQYTLIANSSLGTANQTLEIEVLYKPRILDCPEHATLKAGESLNTSVSCTAEGNPSPVVTWYRNQSEFNPSTPLTRRDGGKYILIANNANGTANHTLVLSVQYKPSIIGCRDHMEPREGESLGTLEPCIIEGNPSPMVTWYRNQSKVNSLRLLTRNDGGQYIFVAKNNHGIANHTLEMNILYPPTFERERVRVNFTEGEEAILECLAEGNPAPLLSWRPNAQNLNLSTRGKYTIASIKNITLANAGDYICNAANDLGTAFKTFTVTVTGKRTRKRGFIYIWLIFIGFIFALVLLILCCRSRMKRRRLYHVTRVRSSSRKERAEIPLMTLNSNGTTSKPAIEQLNSGQSH